MLTTSIKQTREYKRLLAAIQAGAGATAVFGLPPSARAAVLSALKAHTVWVATDGPARDEAARAERAARPAPSVSLGTAPRD